MIFQPLSLPLPPHLSPLDLKRAASINATVEWITPEQAALYLACSLGNRKIKDASLKLLVGQFLRHLMVLNGEPLIFDWDGALRDGHHRLKSCVLSKVGFLAFVVRGVDPQVWATHNTGISRTALDVTHMDDPASKGLKNLLATIYRLYDWKTNNLAKAGTHNSGLTPQDCLGIFHRNPGLQASLSAVSPLHYEHVCSASRVAWFHYLTHLDNPQQCDLFFQRLISGASLQANDPIFVLRRLYMRSFGRHAETKLELPQALSALIKAWNAFLSGTSVSKFSYMGAYPVINLQNPLLWSSMI